MEELRLCQKDLGMTIRFLILLLLISLPISTNAQNFISNNEIDTIYDYVYKKPILFVIKDSTGIKYKQNKSDNLLSNDIKYIKGKESLEKFLRDSYYRRFSQECVGIYVPFVVLFNKRLKIKGLHLLYCPPFIQSSYLINFLKEEIKRTNGMWETNDNMSEGYFYIGRLIII